MSFIEIPLGAPILAATCEFSDDRVRMRMQQGVPIASAEEYLVRIRLESERIPEIVSAKHLPTSLKRPRVRRVRDSWKIPAQIPRIVLPENEKERVQRCMDTFCDARDLIGQWEDVFTQNEDIRSSRLNPPRFPDVQERTQWIEYCDQNPPLLHIVLQMSNIHTIRSIRHLSRHFELSLQECPDGNGLTHPLAAWTFALLARVEVPYTDDVGSLLRKLLRLIVTACDIRARSEPTWWRDDHTGELNPMVLVRLLLENAFQVGDED